MKRDALGKKVDEAQAMEDPENPYDDLMEYFPLEGFGGVGDSEDFSGVGDKLAGNEAELTGKEGVSNNDSKLGSPKKAEEECVDDSKLGAKKNAQTEEDDGDVDDVPGIDSAEPTPPDWKQLWNSKCCY